MAIDKMNQEPSELSTIIEALRTPFTYLTFFVLAVWAWASEPASTLNWLLPFAFLLSLMILIDMRHMILPDTLNAVLFVSGLLLHFLWFDSLLLSALGAGLGFILFFFIFYITYIIKGEPAMGFGDVKFITALGAWVGVVGVPLILIYATILALSFIVLRAIKEKSFQNKPFAYGPFLAIAGWLSMLYTFESWKIIETLRASMIGA